jgi:hypothetical protein
LQSVNSDLEYAIDHLPTTLVRGRARKPAAQALKARVALHEYYITQNTAFLTQAISQATDVINHGMLELETNYASLYNREPNKESIFEVAFNDQDRTLIARYFAHTSLAGRYEFAPTDNYLSVFDSDDTRKVASVAMAGNAPYGIKSMMWLREPIPFMYCVLPKCTSSGQRQPHCFN